MGKQRTSIKILDASTRGIEPTPGAIGEVFLAVRSIDADKREIRFMASTGDVDRYGEVVEPKAFAKDLPEFLTNPVFIAGHIYIGASGKPTVIGHWKDLVITEKGLEGTAVFAQTELAEEYWQLYRGGHIRAVSIGFLPVTWEMRQLDVGGRKELIRTFTRVKLLEISAVSIPANAGALVQNCLLPADDEHPDVDAAIERALAKYLNTDPGSHMSVLIQDTVQATLAAGGRRCGGHGDDHGKPEPVAESDPGKKELVAKLSRLRDAWRK